MRLVVTTEQPEELRSRGTVLGPLGAGTRRRRAHPPRPPAGGAQGPEAARRLFARLDESAVWCDARARTCASAHAASPALPRMPFRRGLLGRALAAAAAGLERAPLRARGRSSDYLAAAPCSARRLNPTRDRTRLGFLFRAGPRRATASRRRWRAAASSARRGGDRRARDRPARALRTRNRGHPGLVLDRRARTRALLGTRVPPSPAPCGYERPIDLSPRPDAWASSRRSIGELPAP